MKIQSNNIKNSEQVLGELLELTNEVGRCVEWLTPFGKHDKAIAKTFPEYLGKVRLGLQGCKLANFEIEYPSIADVLANGKQSDDGMHRFFDGIYKLGTLHKELSSRKFMVKTEKDCTELQGLAKRVGGDLVIFIITQFGLTGADSAQLGVAEYCQKCGLTPDVLYGQCLHYLDTFETAPYGYEVISPYNTQLLDIDPTLMSECEEAGFPLTEDLCEQLVTGEILPDEVRGKLQAYLSSTKEVDVGEISPGNMLKKMSLS